MISRKQSLLFVISPDCNDLHGVDFIGKISHTHPPFLFPQVSRGFLVCLFWHRTGTSTSLWARVLGYLVGYPVSCSSTTGFLLVKKNVSKIGSLCYSSIIAIILSVLGNPRLIRWQVPCTLTIHLWVMDSLTTCVYLIEKQSNEIRVR